MAKVKTNPIIEQLRGKVGDLVFKNYSGEVIVSRKPEMEGREPTQAQAAQREQFRQAAFYGKMVMADAAAKAVYEEAAKAKGQPVFSLTVADFFNAPSVDEVDLSAYTGNVGDPIAIRASDDFAVSSVNVAVTKADGAAIEEGPASETPPKSGRWLYRATAAVPTGTTVKIAVTAKDRPGHTGVKETSKP